jgi:hypothetical protein
MQTTKSARTKEALGVLPKSHIVENWRFLRVQIILAENQNAPRVNLARHFFFAFANGDLGNTPKRSFVPRGTCFYSQHSTQR